MREEVRLKGVLDWNKIQSEASKRWHRQQGGGTSTKDNDNHDNNDNDEDKKAEKKKKANASKQEYDYGYESYADAKKKVREEFRLKGILAGS